MTDKKLHEDICMELTSTYVRKNTDYGDAFSHSLDKHGLIASVVRMEDKMGRLSNLVEADRLMVTDETFEDTLLDLANYAIMTVMWLRAGGIEDGKPKLSDVIPVVELEEMYRMNKITTNQFRELLGNRPRSSTRIHDYTTETPDYFSEAVAKMKWSDRIAMSCGADFDGDCAKKE